MASPWQRMATRVGRRRLLSLIRFYPPYLGAGIRVRDAAPDLAWIEVEMPLRPWTQNYLGTQFGGSLYSMCDPWFVFMLIERLPSDWVVWDKAATIRFRKPGRGKVRARFEI